MSFAIILIEALQISITIDHNGSTFFKGKLKVMILIGIYQFPFFCQSGKVFVDENEIQFA